MWCNAIWRKIDRPLKMVLYYETFFRNFLKFSIVWDDAISRIFKDWRSRQSRILPSEEIKKNCFLKKPFTCQLALGVGCCWFAWRTGRRFRPSVPPWPSRVRWQTGWSKPPHPDPPYQPSSRLSSTSQGLKIRSVKKRSVNQSLFKPSKIFHLLA